MKTKKCNHCKNDYPKTLKYFFKKKCKQKLATTGKIKTYYSFRHICIKCWRKNSRKNRVEKRCKEFGWDKKDHDKLSNQNRLNNIWANYQIKYPKAKEILDLNEYRYFLKLKSEEIDIEPENYRKRIENNKIERNKRIAKINRPVQFTKEELRLKRKDDLTKYRKDLHRTYIANVILRCKLKDVTKTEIEQVKQSLIVKRKLRHENKTTT